MTEKTHIQYDTNHCISQEDMIAYIKGSLSKDEMYRIERHTSECEMCKDELEGLMLLDSPEQITVITNELNAKIHTRTKSKKSILFFRRTFLTAAASILIIFGIGYIAFLITAPSEEILITEHTKITEIPQNSIKSSKEQIIKPHAEYNNTIEHSTQENISETENIEQENNNIEEAELSFSEIITADEQEQDIYEESIEIAEEPTIVSEPIAIGYAAPKQKKMSMQNSQEKELITAEAEVDTHAEIQETRVSAPAMDIVIRGRGTSSEPQQILYVVDGKIIGYEYTGDPENIASLSILKGEEASKKYGSQGWLGVAEITTKQTNDSYTKATYKFGSSKDFVKAIVSRIPSNILIQTENSQFTVFCEIDSLGTIEVLDTDIVGNAELEQKIKSYIEENTDWLPAQQNGKAVSSLHMFHFDI